MPTSVLNRASADRVSDSFSHSKYVLFKALADTYMCNRYCRRYRYQAYVCRKKSAEPPSTGKKRKKRHINPSKSCFMTTRTYKKTVEFDDVALRQARVHEHRNRPCKYSRSGMTTSEAKQPSSFIRAMNNHARKEAFDLAVDLEMLTDWFIL